MGITSSIESKAAQKPRQTSPPPQNQEPIFDETFGETATTLVPHDQASPSSTVTPLPKDADIVVMAPGMAKTYGGETAAFLAGRSSREPVVFSFSALAEGLTHRGKPKWRITGIDANGALAGTFNHQLAEMGATIKSFNGKTIKFRLDVDEAIIKSVATTCRNVEALRNLRFDDEAISEILHSGFYGEYKKEYTDYVIIKFFEMDQYVLIVRCCLGNEERDVERKLMAVLKERLENRRVDLSAVPAGRNPEDRRQELIALFCLDLCTREKPDPLQAARLVDDHLVLVNATLPCQEMVMSCLLETIRVPDDAFRLHKHLGLSIFSSDMRKTWAKRLEVRSKMATMPGGPTCDPSALMLPVVVHRKFLIDDFLANEHCEIAYELICDLSTALDRRPDLLDLETRDLCALRDLSKFTIKLSTDERLGKYPHFTGQVGKMMLRELLANSDDPSTIADHHLALFRRLQTCMNGIDGEVIARELLDFPEAELAALMRNDKARHLLRMTRYPALADRFAKIEGEANELILRRLKALQKRDLAFSNFEGDVPLAIIPLRSVRRGTVNRLLDLAEAAVLTTGLVNWSVGVLQFLSTELLSPRQVKRAVALCDRVDMAIRYNPDSAVGNNADPPKERFLRNAEVVFLDRLKKLKDSGIVIPADPLLTNETDTVEIDGGIFGAETVDLLLDLAQAAVNGTGWTNWAVAVLQFLSDRVLLGDQLNRAELIRDGVQSAVRDHPDPQVAKRLETVTTLTDAAIKEMKGS